MTLLWAKLINPRQQLLHQNWLSVRHFVCSIGMRPCGASPQVTHGCCEADGVAVCIDNTQVAGAMLLWWCNSLWVPPVAAHSTHVDMGCTYPSRCHCMAVAGMALDDSRLLSPGHKYICHMINMLWLGYRHVAS
jgi:hypothetical protein